MSDNAVVPGKILSRPLTHPVTGKILLPAGTVLTDAYIERLTRQGLDTELAACLQPLASGESGGVPGVRDLDAFDIDIPDINALLGDIIASTAAAAPEIAASVAVQTAASGPASVSGAPSAPSAPPAPTGPRYHHNPGHMMTERSVMGAMHAVEQLESQLKHGQVPPYEGLLRVVDEVCARLGGNAQGLHQGMEIRIVNQPHGRAHPVNVMVLSVAMGLALNYDQQQLRILAVGALCHDIGKTAIPSEILDKVGPLTPHEVELLRQHPLMGKRIMDKLPWGTPLLGTIVYQHHERVDGSGYPQRLTGANIHEMSKIVAVAEVYDALISDTSYRTRFSPEAAYNMIRSGEKMGFDPTVVRAFSRYIVPFPLHSFVKLDSGEVGQVVQISRQNPARPVVRIGKQTVDLAHDGRKIVNSHFQAF